MEFFQNKMPPPSCSINCHPSKLKLPPQKPTPLIAKKEERKKNQKSSKHEALVERIVKSLTTSSSVNLKKNAVHVLLRAHVHRVSLTHSTRSFLCAWLEFEYDHNVR